MNEFTDEELWDHERQVVGGVLEGLMMAAQLFGGSINTEQLLHIYTETMNTSKEKFDEAVSDESWDEVNNLMDALFEEAKKGQ